MATFELRGLDQTEVQQLAQQLTHEFKAVSTDTDWQVAYTTDKVETGATRSIDLVPYIPIAVAAVSAGGALTVLLGQDGILAKIAQIIEKHIEGKKTEVIVKAADGSSIELRANMSAGDIQRILREMNRRDNTTPTSTTNSPHA